MRLNKDEEKIIKRYRKENKKKKHKKGQHTKIILNILIVAFCIVCIASIYINYKNGLGMDGIFANICDVMKWCLPCGFGKAILETREEKRMRLEYLSRGIDYDNYETNEINESNENVIL